MPALASYSPLAIFGICLVSVLAGFIQQTLCPVDMENGIVKPPSSMGKRACQGILGLVACAACLMSTFIILAKIFAQ